MFAVRHAVPEARQQGVGRALIASAEDRGRVQGCREFASDAHTDNDISRAAHRAVGFTDKANRGHADLGRLYHGLRVR